MLIFSIIVIVVPFLLFGGVNWYQNHLAPLPYYGENYEIEKSQPYYFVPGFSFTDQKGNPVDQSFVKNKVWVANFFFTSCPSICPQMMHNLTKVQAAFTDNNNVRIVSFTVDPEHDTPEKMNQYAQHYGINAEGWQLATGTKKDLYRFARKGLFLVATDGDGGPDDFIHSQNLVLIDKADHVRGYYDGTSDTDIKKLIADIKTLQ